MSLHVELPSSKGGSAWDDSELVHAYDAAMDEFHLHHPGPGSWLDKATAALATGQPLPGATVLKEEWYTSSAPKDAPAKLVETPTPANPYQAPVVANAAPASPTWQPVSPRPAVAEQASESSWPEMSLHAAATVTPEQAMAYAMSAQYMAGYWMGVAHGRASEPHPESLPDPLPTNILFTKHVSHAKIKR